MSWANSSVVIHSPVRYYFLHILHFNWLNTFHFCRDLVHTTSHAILRSIRFNHFLLLRSSRSNRFTLRTRLFYDWPLRTATNCIHVNKTLWLRLLRCGKFLWSIVKCEMNRTFLCFACSPLAFLHFSHSHFNRLSIHKFNMKIRIRVQPNSSHFPLFIASSLKYCSFYCQT